MTITKEYTKRRPIIPRGVAMSLSDKIVYGKYKQEKPFKAINHTDLIEADDVKQFIKELKGKRDWKGVVHRNSCGCDILDKDGSIVITCGESLDSSGMCDDFAQCPRCRDNDFIDFKAGKELTEVSG